MPQASANSENTPTVASTARNAENVGLGIAAADQHDAGRGGDQDGGDQQHQDDAAAARRSALRSIANASAPAACSAAAVAVDRGFVSAVRGTVARYAAHLPVMRLLDRDPFEPGRLGHASLVSALRHRIAQEVLRDSVHNSAASRVTDRRSRIT